MASNAGANQQHPLQDASSLETLRQGSRTDLDSPPDGGAGDVEYKDSHDNNNKEKGAEEGQAGLGPSPAAAAPAQLGPPGGPPPNGGLQAWLQVLGGFMLFFNTWGILNTFGVFQTYYESGALFTETSSNISWIGAIQAYLVLVVGCFSGPVFDRGYFRTLLLTGSFLVVFGFMMTSLCTEFWQCILAQGFCIGLGAGLLFVPAVAILPTYFSTRLGLAVGLAAAGSSSGGIIYPIVFYRLIDRIGFGWSVRVLGFIALASLMVPIFVMRVRVRPARARALLDTTAFTDAPFIIFIAGATLGFIGLYVMFFYISFFASSRGITDESLAFYLIPILNAGSVFGRTVPNAISDRSGPLNLIVPGALLCAVISFCMIAVDSVAGVVCAALFFGFFSGVFIALPPVIIVALTRDKSKIGTRLGMGFGVMGFGCLAGGPGGGDILQDYGPDYNWTGMWAYGGAATLLAAIIFAVVRFLRVGTKIAVKV